MDLKFLLPLANFFYTDVGKPSIYMQSMMHLIIATNCFTAFFFPFDHDSLWSKRLVGGSIAAATMLSIMLHAVPLHVLPALHANEAEWDCFSGYQNMVRPAGRPCATSNLPLRAIRCLKATVVLTTIRASDRDRCRGQLILSRHVCCTELGDLAQNRAYVSLLHLCTTSCFVVLLHQNKLYRTHDSIAACKHFCCMHRSVTACVRVNYSKQTKCSSCLDRSHAESRRLFPLRCGRCCAQHFNASQDKNASEEWSNARDERSTGGRLTA